jgi:hypothetical protein
MIRHLLVPGLLGPLANTADAARVPRLPAVERLLARADRSPGRRGFTEQACALFGLQQGDRGELPTGALLYALDAAARPNGWVLQADPVHLRPDGDRLLLFDAGRLDVAPAEAARYVGAFNDHFAADGLRLAAPTPSRWFLLTDRDPGIATVPLHEAAGRDMNRSLPTGERRRFWVGLLNEVQMLFHQLGEDTAREHPDRPSISGIWLSGGGRMPSLSSAVFQRTDADGGLVDALFAACPAQGGEPLLPRTGPLRALMDADHAGWCAAVTAIDRELGRWLSTADDLVLYPCNGTAHRWQRAHAWRWWRRPRALADEMPAVLPRSGDDLQTP